MSKYSNQNTARAYQRARYKRCKEAGVCPNCAIRAPRPGNVTCEVCGERNKRINLRRRRKLVPLWKGLRICLQCGSRAAMDNRVWCGVCSEGHAEKMRSLAYRRMDAGLCRRCGGEMDRVGTQCEKCCAKRRKRATE